MVSDHFDSIVRSRDRGDGSVDPSRGYAGLKDDGSPVVSFTGLDKSNVRQVQRQTT